MCLLLAESVLWERLDGMLVVSEGELCFGFPVVAPEVSMAYDEDAFAALH